MEKGCKKPPLIILTGPTAVGKSSLSISVAQAINAEIISADSMQVYKGMDIGTDKISTDRMCGIRHHLINILDPKDEFNVALFKKLANDSIHEIYGRNHIPMIVGGTGFYIQAVLYDIDFTETDSDESYRHELEQEAINYGNEYLHEKLKDIDPEAYDLIHANNVKRVIRALEFHQKTGKCISEHNKQERQKQSPYDFRYFVLTDERSILYSRIDRRVDEMIQNGLEQEVRRILNDGVPLDATSMQGLGYREMAGYIRGEYDLERAIFLIKRNTRHFAKRQLTWFRREKDVIWIDKAEYNRESEKIKSAIFEKIEAL